MNSQSPSLFQNKAFVVLWIAQLFSGIGAVLFEVGVVVLVFNQTGSALQTAGITVSQALFPFLFGSLAGPLIDRYPRHLVLIGMELTRFVAVGSLWFVADGAELNILVIYGLMGVIALGEAVSNASRLALVPQIVSQEQTIQANGLLYGVRPAFYIVGFFAGSFLILNLRLQNFVLLDISFFLLAIVTLTIFGWVSRNRAKTNSQTGLNERQANHQIWKDIVEGLSFLRKNEVPRKLVIMEILEFFPHGIWTPVLILLFIQDGLGGTEQDWGIHASLYFTGQFVGALIAVSLARYVSKKPGWIIIGNAGLSSIFTFFYAASPTLILSHVLAFMYGPPAGIRDVAQDSLLQAVVDNEIQGRIFSLRQTFFSVTFMLGSLFFATLADLFSIRAVFTTGAVLYGLTALYAASSRALRESSIKIKVPVGD
ncbi:MAG: MFS transporter [Chloroflexota bacterium]